MEILYQVEDFKDDRKPIVLTIGNFDGVHRGHLAVLRGVKEIAGNKSRILVITFSNHPSEILRPNQPIALLCTLEHRIRLIEDCGIHSLLLLPFTNYLAQHSAKSFVERLRQSIPFTHLVLGHDATLGRDRQGDRRVMKELAHDWGFDVHYLEEYRYEGHPVSSSRIRELLQMGDLENVEMLLGRPYSIYSKAILGMGIEQDAGLTLVNLNVNRLCLPPFGLYAVKVKKNDDILNGIANLGNARLHADPILEVFLKDHNLENDQEIEVIFDNLIHPDKKFESREDLYRQIKHELIKSNDL